MALGPITAGLQTPRAPATPSPGMDARTAFFVAAASPQVMGAPPVQAARPARPQKILATPQDNPPERIMRPGSFIDIRV